MDLLKIKDILRNLRNKLYTCCFQFRKKGIEVDFSDRVLLKHCVIAHNVKGGGNSLTVKSGSRLIDCKIYFFGKNNRVIIHENVRLVASVIWIEDNENVIEIGEYSSMENGCSLSACEGTKISIGKDCMFSSKVNIRTTDSHPLLDLDGKRINPAEDIVIGNHVWIGQDVLLMKGAQIADDSVVGARSLVNKKLSERNCVYAGLPAKKVKQDINWSRHR